jgi:hypothetical protein
MSDMKKPNFKGADTEQAIISEMMRWLHDRGCAVVVWTEQELRGVDPSDLENGMIEWSSESIEMNADEEQTQ